MTSAAFASQSHIKALPNPGVQRTGFASLRSARQPLTSRLTGREVIERLGQEAIEGDTIPTLGSSRRNVASA
jgi:hypothetical protein